jgi:asparagine synthase (glutamine-hydrolysing)
VSAILGVLDGAPRRDTDEISRRMLSHMSARGGERWATWGENGITLGVARSEWEFKAGFAGPVFVVQDGSVFVAADATLYYRDSLRKRISERGIRVGGQTPSHLIAAAYRVWGERCAEHLEGDFAFLLWDRQAKRLIAARDFAGKRPLYFTSLATGGIAFASSLDALREHPECEGSLNLRAIAEMMASCSRVDGSTCYASISRLVPGFTAIRSTHRALRVISHWDPAPPKRPRLAGKSDASDAVHDLFVRSVAERLAANQPTAVWLSGGRSSSAVFATALELEARGDRSPRVFPMTLRLPRDQGPSAELIESITAVARYAPRWVDARLDEVDVRDELASEGSLPDVRQAGLRALAREGSTCNARVALDGEGGAAIVSRAAGSMPDSTPAGGATALLRALFRRLRSGALDEAEARALPAGCLQMHVPAWIEREFRRHALSAHSHWTSRWRHTARSLAGSRGWRPVDPFSCSVHRAAAETALTEGVELRSPLLDKRMLAFLALRPQHVRLGSEYLEQAVQRALRGALRAPMVSREESIRSFGNLASSALSFLRPYLAELPRRPALAELGIVNPRALRRACESYLRGGDRGTGLHLLLTLQVEHWVRARWPEVTSRRGAIRSPSGAPMVSSR